MIGGLEEQELSQILNCIERVPGIDRVVLFGSRAKETHERESDVDLTVFAESAVAASRLSALLNEETMLPYRFDVIDYGSITSRDLLDHIHRVGIDIASGP